MCTCLPAAAASVTSHRTELAQYGRGSRGLSSNAVLWLSGACVGATNCQRYVPIAHAHMIDLSVAHPSRLSRQVHTSRQRRRLHPSRHGRPNLVACTCTALIFVLKRCMCFFPCGTVHMHVGASALESPDRPGNIFFTACASNAFV